MNPNLILKIAKSIKLKIFLKLENRKHNISFQIILKSKKKIFAKTF